MLITVQYELCNAKLLHYACDSFCILAVSMNGVILLDVDLFAQDIS